jgi:ABC-type amino acid transport substrate-binding protein
VDLARALAGRLGLALSPMVVDSTAMSVDAVVRGQADIGFFALHQARAGELRFTAPYLLVPAQFNIIQQAIGMRARHSDEALARVQQFVEDMKADGFVARALKRHNIVGVHVAPLQ